MADAAQGGYDRGRQFIADEILPSLQALRAALAEYQNLQVEAYETTSARLPDLGRCDLRAASLDELIQRLGRTGQ